MIIDIALITAGLVMLVFGGETCSESTLPAAPVAAAAGALSGLSSVGSNSAAAASPATGMVNFQ